LLQEARARAEPLALQMVQQPVDERAVGLERAPDGVADAYDAGGYAPAAQDCFRLAGHSAF